MTRFDFEDVESMATSSLRIVVREEDIKIIVHYLSKSITLDKPPRQLIANKVMCC